MYVFKTTEEHEALFRMQVREFVETEVKPIAAILDKENKFLGMKPLKNLDKWDLWVYLIQKNMVEQERIF